MLASLDTGLRRLGFTTCLVSSSGICTSVQDCTGTSCTHIAARLGAACRLTGAGLTAKAVGVDLCLTGAAELGSGKTGRGSSATAVVGV